MFEATIPFNRPGLAGNEWRYISEALEAMHISGDGAFTRKCQALLENGALVHAETLHRLEALL